MSEPVFFQCAALGAKLSLAACIANHRTSRYTPAQVKARRKPGVVLHQFGLVPCVECAIGKEHARTKSLSASVEAVEIVSRSTTKAKLAIARPKGAKAPVDALLAERIMQRAAELRSAVVAHVATLEGDRRSHWPDHIRTLAVAMVAAGATTRQVSACGISEGTVDGWVRRARAAAWPEDKAVAS